MQSESASMTEKEREIFGLLFQFYSRGKTHIATLSTVHTAFLAAFFLSFLSADL